MEFIMNWDLLVAIANILLTVGIIPQLIKNYKTKNVESHCIFWHLSTISGLSLLFLFYYSLYLYFATFGICITICFRLIIIYQIFKYRVKK